MKLARQLGLLAINFALTAKFITPAVPLLLYLGIGYLIVLHASVSRDRLTGWWWCVPKCAIALGAWLVAWFAFKKAPSSDGLAFLERFPSLGLTAFHPNIVGASYIFLKVYDLIRRAQRGEPPPGLIAYLTQMTFYPSFAAGPIAGPEPFASGFAPTRATIGDGLNKLLTGVLKLYVIAQLLEPANLLGPTNARALAELLERRDVWIGVYGSSLWIYFNFAGWSDIAIGLGLLMGVRLPENFDAPYLASNPSEFWQRWHMSFTSWLREHVFSPVSRALVARGLGGTIPAMVAGTSATMIACGLWHRVSLSFLVWGAYHAGVVSAHQIFASRLKPALARAGLGPFLATRPYRVLATVATFHAIAIGWVLFLPLDASLDDHLAILRRLFA